jgi:uncharacterized membrane protein YcaP (DUF421 family)
VGSQGRILPALGGENRTAPSAGEEVVCVGVRELALTAGRAILIYVFLLVVIRALGKRTVGNFTAFDLIVALIIGEVVDEPIFGDVPVAQGLLAIAVVGALHFGNSFLSYLSPAFDRLTAGAPRLLVKNGTLDRRAMAMERVNEQELWSLLRMRQIDDLDDVKEAWLETTGELSVLRTEDARELQKGDLKRSSRKGA